MITRQATLRVGDRAYAYYPIASVEGAEELPFSLKVLLENVLRHADSDEAASAMASRIVSAAREGRAGDEVEFSPARVLFQDFTGVPVFVDFAVMREACAALGGDPKRINPQVPCDLVVDHSIIADVSGCPASLEKNEQLEYERNRERYEFLKWAQASFDNVRIVPPGQGICHQLNIEQFARVVMTAPAADAGTEGGGACEVAFFDTVVGTDSHTPTANGIGVLGWGVGGIEAEAAALGQPITTLVPRVVGIELTGELAPGVTAMDVALTLAEVLRKRDVVGCFVECYGAGVAALSATQRACISNMTPEYGSTCTLFPVDERTIEFLRMTGRAEEQIALVEAYARAQGMWGGASAEGCRYSETVRLDLASVAPSVAGPSRPHERVSRSQLKVRFTELCDRRGLSLDACVRIDTKEDAHELTHGAIAIAAVTSCTTATDPAMMLQAGLLARNAARLGLRAKPWVKTIFAPGSHATELLLERAGLLSGLQQLGFFTCGFGCMSCIGNSGPLMSQMHDVAGDIELASVLSGNRNFEGRISPDVSQNYLMAPASVVAFAIAGTVDFDVEHDPLGHTTDGDPLFLRDIMPDQSELDAMVEQFVTADLYASGSEAMYDGDPIWQALSVSASDTFAWDEQSTYVRRPPYFEGMTLEPPAVGDIEDAVVLAFLDDFVTTDHISPAGAIAPDMPAAAYLREHGIEEADFNTYGSRRGNHEVMARGTFSNVKLQNRLSGGMRGGYTANQLTGRPSTLYEAADAYLRAGVPSIVIAGKMYGSGSSRDWAAKGPMLLGVKAALAESFERIHRSNLIGMGILPLQFVSGESAEVLGLDGTERYSISGIAFSDGVPEEELVDVTATRSDGSAVEFKALVRIDTPTEGKYYVNGGILPYVLRGLV